MDNGGYIKDSGGGHTIVSIHFLIFLIILFWQSPAEPIKLIFCDMLPIVPGNVLDKKSGSGIRFVRKTGTKIKNHQTFQYIYISKISPNLSRH